METERFETEGLLTEQVISQQPAMLKVGIESREAFDRAITEGRLSGDDDVWNYAGWYMFMGNEGGRDLFKNINTRKYDV